MKFARNVQLDSKVNQTKNTKEDFMVSVKGVNCIVMSDMILRITQRVSYLIVDQDDILSGSHFTVMIIGDDMII